jgi:hypothetical protein
LASVPDEKRTAVPSTVELVRVEAHRLDVFESAAAVSVSDTRVATRSPTATPHLRAVAAASTPIQVTRPSSMPPDPVTGFCILPRSRTISAMRAPTRAASPPCSSAICRIDAESDIQRLDRDVDLVRVPRLGSGSSLRAA